ncbi:hypothetical protein L3X38_016184 [Prunus dulcis]|uniref:Uncharacterized protein n=1 Tax=Prunus dulcis TaxID=3755 RepID=A0AAD4W4T1_PRUDU|nr:hypothetical protein L3X38_016184 [Prunus dulcis]
MLTDFEGAARKNEVGFRIWTSKEFHHSGPQMRYFMRKRKKVKKSNGQVLAIDESMFFAVGKWFLLNSSPGEIQFVAEDVKEATSEASSRIL